MITTLIMLSSSLLSTPSHFQLWTLLYSQKKNKEHLCPLSSPKTSIEMMPIASTHSICQDAICQDVSCVATDVPTFSFTDFIFVKSLGTGSFSHVFQVTIKKGYFRRNISDMEYKSYALKFPKTAEARELIKTEAQILSILDHSNVVKLKGVGLSEEHCPSHHGCFFIMECLKEETLQHRINRWRRSRSLRKMKQHMELDIALSIARAMTYLHSKSIILRDLKPENVGFDNNDNVRLFDFGLACRCDHPGLDGEITGSLRYMDPHSMMGKSNGMASDVFSFGVVLYELISLRRPYASYRGLNRSASCVDTLMDLAVVQRRKPGPARYAKAFRQIVNQCWEYEPASRPSFCEIEQCLQEMKNSCGQKRGVLSFLRPSQSQQRCEDRSGNRSEFYESSSTQMLECSFSQHTF
mmetsp:Transcript_7011/g.12997  ORF Transcript_7011/g.12997 Transcript_7011/m.12997 type:complete len:410 (-) Transcript_7011:434-1663(-)